ncbi:CpXC domain-containing protein [Lentisphaera marina]|uniref:CpXC domain-containing protein n=1 Tax=Lentisphaera marina TaxID=1111041 RepID=UPI0023665EE2|nr:CpXC domain-containing protein [Lentisphaera marina]MDD7984044.1 CpXC domain-containing protein [Lentisphaera marina]
MENQISCPNCEAPIEYEIVDSIHEQSSAIQELFEGSLNRVNCHECAIEFHVQTPITFRSEDGQFIIFFKPRAEGEDWRETEKQMQIVLDEMASELPPELDPEARLVLDRNQFIEKIAAYINNIDDRIMEYIKFVMYRNGDAVWPLQDLYYDFNTTENDHLEFTLMARKTGKAEQTLSVPMEVYQQFVDDEHNEFDPDAIFPSLYVQVESLMDK